MLRISSMGGDTAVIIFVVVIVCCVVSSIVTMVANAKGGSKSSNIDSILGALKNFKFTNETDILTVPDAIDNTNPFSYNLYTDFTVGSFANIGAAVPNKTNDQCSSLCTTTPGCRGYSNDSGCQLYNNVSILDRKKGSTVHASGDIGAVQYLHVPFGSINIPGTVEVSSSAGGVSTIAPNCIRKRTDTPPCTGFTISGQSGKLYNQITALDSADSSMDTYIDPNFPAKFIKEGKFRYTDTPTKTTSLPITWYLTLTDMASTNNANFFTIWSNPGFDAGTDKYGTAGQAANTIPVTSLSQCYDACKANAWCQSFTVNSGITTCYQRNGITPQHFPLVTANGSTCAPVNVLLLHCTCGYDAAAAACVGYTNAHDGTSGTSNTSYVKKQYPIDLSCPAQCSNDELCKMVTFDSSNCNIYDFVPTGKTPSTTTTSVWMFDNFPG